MTFLFKTINLLLCEQYKNIICEFLSPSWVNIDGISKGYPRLATCGGIFHGSMGEFIGVFSAFLEV